MKSYLIVTISLFLLLTACTNNPESNTSNGLSELKLNAKCDEFVFDSTLADSIVDGTLESVKSKISACAKLENIIDSNYDENYFRLAWENDSLVIYLLANGADTNYAVVYGGMDIFENAIFDRKDTLIQYMLSAGYVPGDDAIAYAAAKNDPELLDTLLKLGLDVNNAHYLSQNMPLLNHLCSWHLGRESGMAYIPITMTLLENGIDPTIASPGVNDCAPNAGADALYECVGQYTPKMDSLLLPVIRKMVENGADPLRPVCFDSGQSTNALEHSKSMPLVHAYLDSISKE